MTSQVSGCEKHTDLFLSTRRPCGRFSIYGEMATSLYLTHMRLAKHILLIKTVTAHVLYNRMTSRGRFSPSVIRLVADNHPIRNTVPLQLVYDEHKGKRVKPDPNSISGPAQACMQTHITRPENPITLSALRYSNQILFFTIMGGLLWTVYMMQVYLTEINEDFGVEDFCFLGSMDLAIEQQQQVIDPLSSLSQAPPVLLVVCSKPHLSHVYSKDCLNFGKRFATSCCPAQVHKRLTYLVRSLMGS